VISGGGKKSREILFFGMPTVLDEELDFLERDSPYKRTKKKKNFMRSGVISAEK
jgi:hypothetical protein